MELVIGNQNYSTWSLRPWLLLTAFEVPFTEIKESLAAPDLGARLGAYSPTNRVPVLIDNQLTVWDSLAICEYISERSLDGQGWPADRMARAQARAICAEMHSGFNALRNELPMNCRAKRYVDLSEAARLDVERIDKIWSYYPQQYADHGPWLFGSFSIADCMFAPVALRFMTYGISLSPTSQAYFEAVLAHPAIVKWLAAASEETEIVPMDEAGEDI